MIKTLAMKKVLVVEDEEHNWFLIREFFELHDIETIWVDNGFSALEILKQTDDIAVVLMDVKLPLMSGYELAPKIKALRPDVQILAQTAYALVEDEQRCLKAGCDGYLAKPYSLAELAFAINRLLAKLHIQTIPVL